MNLVSNKIVEVMLKLVIYDGTRYSWCKTSKRRKGRGRVSVRGGGVGELVFFGVF